ncbi:hypothetical protein [Paenibacillus sp. PL2-23]
MAANGAPAGATATRGIVMAAPEQLVGVTATRGVAVTVCSGAPSRTSR